MALEIRAGSKQEMGGLFSHRKFIFSTVVPRKTIASGDKKPTRWLVFVIPYSASQDSFFYGHASQDFFFETDTLQDK